MQVSQEAIGNEFNSVVRTVKNTKHDVVASTANRLNDIGYTHVPAIPFRSGAQYANYLLVTVGELISHYRTIDNHNTKDLQLADKAIRQVENMNDKSVYYFRHNQGHIGLRPMNAEQIKQTFRREI